MGTSCRSRRGAVVDRKGSFRRRVDGFLYERDTVSPREQESVTYCPSPRVEVGDDTPEVDRDRDRPGVDIVDMLPRNTPHWKLQDLKRMNVRDESGSPLLVVTWDVYITTPNPKLTLETSFPSPRSKPLLLPRDCLPNLLSLPHGGPEVRTAPRVRAFTTFLSRT